MFWIILSICLITLHRISGSPDPLVSSSGMIPVPTIDKVEKGDAFSRNEKQMGVPITEPKPSDSHRITGNPVPEVDMLAPMPSLIERDTAEIVDMTHAASPTEIVSKDSIELKSEENLAISPLENVEYNKKSESVLHPYGTETKLITIPTVLITRSPTKSPVSSLDSPSMLQSIDMVPQVHDRSMDLNTGYRENKSPILVEHSAIDWSEALPNGNNKIVINSPEFAFVDKDQLYKETFNELKTPMRIARTINDTINKQKLTTTPKPKTNESEENFTRNGQLKVSQLGPPWQDEEIVGKLFKDPLVEATEVSFRVASKLCKKIASQDISSTDQPKGYYLWAPINQYIPLLRKAFPIRPPLFAPECLKWVLRQCRGTIKLPVLKPCTFWAPMRIRRPECGFNPNMKSKIVNFRLPEFVPVNCPCVWPCTPQFDPVQRCRVSVNQSQQQFDHFYSDGDLWNEKEIVIQESLAAQLCRGMKLALSEDDTISIGWIPIRADVVPGEGHIHEYAHDDSKLRKRKTSQNSALKAKREKVFINPDKGSGLSLEDDDENDDVQSNPIIIQGNDILNCKVWKYKACPKIQSNLELMVGHNTERQRVKRNTAQHISKLELPLNNKNNKNIWKKKRFVRQAEADDDEDDDSFLMEEVSVCGEWIQSESNHCISEERVPTLKKGSHSSSEENGHNQKEITSQKKGARKEICSGSAGKFPCFLRKKRSLMNLTQDVKLKASKRSSGSQKSGNDVYIKNNWNKRSEPEGAVGQNEPVDVSQDIINKIMIQPDPSCMCEWPCLPFFDRVNRCYNSKGELYVDKIGRPSFTARSFRKTQRDPVVCINFVETDEIYCKIK